MSLPTLNAANLGAILEANGQKALDRESLPEKVIQFGEGNFLRAFVDWMFDLLNKRGEFNGRIAVVQPIERGLADLLNGQDGLYTLLMRGLKNGDRIDDAEIIQSISRCINPYSQWDAYLGLARQDEIRYVVSNTTEAGITYVDEAKPEGTCPASFPAKLTALLFERFTAYKGAADKGLVLIPCELIDRNGDKLKACILQHIAAWGLGDDFKAWFENNCPICNTLVDRIVPGYPREEAEELCAKLGYQDNLLDAGEPFHLWVIEGDKELAKELPFTEAGLDVVWTDDMSPYRTRKVRMLNGPHTMMVTACFLAGLDTVRESVDHEIAGAYLKQGLFDEIMPQLPFPDEEKRAFANAILERFGNPFIKHMLLSITLNNTSKYSVRVLPSVKEYMERTGEAPSILCFGLAAAIVFNKPSAMNADHNEGTRGKETYRIDDDKANLEVYAAAWDAHGDNLEVLVQSLLTNEAMWGEDLTALPGFAEMVTKHVYNISKRGCMAAMADVVGYTPCIK